MKILKRMSVALVSLFLCFSLISVAHAADEVTSGIIGSSITWVLYDDGTMVVSGEGLMYDNYTFDDEVKTAVTSIVIEEGVPEIGMYIFSDFTNLTSVSIASSVTSIGKGAFEGCTSLTSIVIPEGVTTIDWYTFEYCSNLASVEFPSTLESIEGYAFAYCPKLSEDIVPDGVEVDEYAFFMSYTTDDGLYEYAYRDDGTIQICSYYGNETDVVVPSTIAGQDVTCIRGFAFAWNEDVVTITIPDTVVDLYAGAFVSCTNLTTVTATNVQYIDEIVFSGCTSLTTVELGNNVEEIGPQAFAGCTSLKDITLPNSLKTIGAYAFEECTSLESIVIPASVEDFGGGLFYNCTNMKTVTFEGDAPTFSSYAFLEVTVTAYYPANNDTWTSDVMQDYLGDVTWVAYSNDEVSDEGTVNFEIASETVQASASYSTEDLLTEEELNSGSDIDFILSIEDANETVTDEDKSIIESILGEYVGIYYLDIDLTKYVDGVASDVTSTSSMITITVTIPDALKETVGDTDGRYVIVRLHDGVTEILEDLDDNDDTITFETDKFSTYAIAFIEAVDDTTTTSTNTTTTPQTSDESIALVYGTLLLATGAAFVAMNRKRYMD